MTTPVSDSDADKCIYCLLRKPGSREHLVPRSIGGNLIGRRVCKACNTGMSDIDQHLGDNAVVSMMKVANTPAGSFDVKLGGEQLLEDPSGRRIPVALRNQYAPTLLPMMRFTPTPTGAEVGVHFSDASDAQRLAKFVGRHRETGFAGLYPKRVDWLHAGEAAVVMHRDKDGYLAIADDAVEARARALLVEKVPKVVEGALQDEVFGCSMGEEVERDLRARRGRRCHGRQAPTNTWNGSRAGKSAPSCPSTRGTATAGTRRPRRPWSSSASGASRATSPDRASRKRR